MAARAPLNRTSRPLLKLVMGSPASYVGDEFRARKFGGESPVPPFPAIDHTHRRLLKRGALSYADLKMLE